MSGYFGVSDIQVSAWLAWVSSECAELSRASRFSWTPNAPPAAPHAPKTGMLARARRNSELSKKLRIAA